jgi:hypothetical protein
MTWHDPILHDDDVTAHACPADFPRAHRLRFNGSRKPRRGELGPSTLLVCVKCGGAARELYRGIWLR